MRTNLVARREERSQFNLFCARTVCFSNNLDSICSEICSGLAMADKSDPRMPTAVRHYVAPIVNPNDLPPDYSSLAAILLGMFGVMMRQKIASWLSLVFIAQSIALMKNPENDLKQIIMALTFAVMGFVTNYFGPSPKTTKT